MLRRRQHHACVRRDSGSGQDLGLGYSRGQAYGRYSAWQCKKPFRVETRVRRRAVRSVDVDSTYVLVQRDAHVGSLICAPCRHGSGSNSLALLQQE